MNRHRARRHHGFMFVELLFILGLVAVAAVISTQLYIDMTRAHSRLLQQREAQARFDGALKALRADVWNAINASVDDAGGLTLKQADGKTIHWLAHEELKRTIDGDPARQWNQLGAQLSFSVEKNTVILHEEPTAKSETKPGRITMPMVAAGLKGVTP
jgi:type II secretory pathway component PulJ